MSKFLDIQHCFTLSSGEVRRAKTIPDALGEWYYDRPISVTVPDNTRPLDVSMVLEHLSKRLTQLRYVIVGLGLHRHMTEDELGDLLQYPIVQHDPDDCVFVPISQSHPTSLEDRYTTVGFSKYLLASPVSMVVGVMEIHQYAGVSSGYKGVVVGCGDRQTISRLHARDVVCDPSVKVGQITHNRFRENIEFLGAHSNCTSALVFVPNLQEWWFGHPASLLQLASQLIPPTMWSYLPPNTRYETVVISVPPSKGRSLYQASRALTYFLLSPHPPCAPNARIILCAEMEEGLGAEQAFSEYLSQHTKENARAKWQEYLTGTEPKGAGAQRLIMLAQVFLEHSIELYGLRDATLFRSIGMDVTNILPSRLDERCLFIDNPFTWIPQCSQSENGI